MREIPAADGLCPSCRSRVVPEGSQTVPDNPFADSLQESASVNADTARDDNPYASCLPPESETRRRNPLLIPAWILLVGSVIWFLLSIWSLGLQLFSTNVLGRLPESDAIGMLIGYVLALLIP